MGKFVRAVLTDHTTRDGKVRQRAPKRTRPIDQRKSRGSGSGKYHLDTYRAVLRFTPGTRLRYGPNRKLVGSKSHARYARYMRARTVGEALLLGSKTADLCWELEHKMYEVLDDRPPLQCPKSGPARRRWDQAQALLDTFKGPQGLSVELNAPNAQEELDREEAWRARKVAYCHELARRLGVRLDGHGGPGGDLPNERRTADVLALQKLRSGRRISDEDVTEVLQCWGFMCNCGRVNVMPPGRRWVYSDTLGAIRQRVGGDFNVTPATRGFPNVTRLFLRWLRDTELDVPCDFVCTSINVNCNYAAVRHRDGNNEGPSVIKAFGPFTGGRLLYWPSDTAREPKPPVESLRQADHMKLDIRSGCKVFDGKRAHEVEPFEGERFSVVFFTARRYHKVRPEDVKFLRRLGFPWPSPASMAALRKACSSGERLAGGGQRRRASGGA